MPRFNTTELINSLKKEVQITIENTKVLQGQDDLYLLKQPQPDKWSIAQVLEHLNGYNRFYLKEIDRAIKFNNRKTVETFKSGVLGNYFTNMMQPKEGKISNKMKAPKDYTYSNNLEPQKVIAEFLQGQEKLLLMLDDVKVINVNKIKLPISISKLIKLKLGDVARFLVAHQQRHFLQIDNIKQTI